MPKSQKRTRRKGGGLVVTDATIRQTLEEYERDDRLDEISDWNVSQVTNMFALFADLDTFNADLSKWDVSNVTNMSRMFSGCEQFDGKGLVIGM